MSKVIYGQAVATRGDHIWCENCGTALDQFRERFVDPKDHLRLTNVGGITTITDGDGWVLHRCDEASTTPDPVGLGMGVRE